MTKELINLWLDKGFNLNGHYAFQKKHTKYYPAYVDNLGIQHEAREVTFAQNIDFDNEHKVYSVSSGTIQEGTFIPHKVDSITIGIETLRLICKTVKELGWN